MASAISSVPQQNHATRCVGCFGALPAPMPRPRCVAKGSKVPPQVASPTAIPRPLCTPVLKSSIGRTLVGLRRGGPRPQRTQAQREPSFDAFSNPPADNLRISSGGVAKKSMGVYWILLLNFILFGLAKFGGQMWITNLYLNSAHPQWWQFVTCTFCHFDWAHLSQNAFFLLVFGKLVEEEEGWFGLWASYLLCGVGGALASHLLGGGHGYSLGASGAVFGLFTISVLLKLQLSIWKILEFVILGQFVLTQVMTEVAHQAAVTGGKAIAGSVTISHVAHLGGALVGVMLVLVLSRLPEAK